MRSSTSRSRSESIGAGCSAVGSNTVIPTPTIRTARATSRASQSLETKPEAPAARAAAGDIRPAPEISSTRVDGDALRIESHTSAPDSPARNRSTRATSGRSVGSSAQRLGAGARRQAALHPWLLAQQHPEAPVHDVVVVHHQHPQLAVRRRRAGG